MEGVRKEVDAMIAIVNVSKVLKNVGAQTYEIRINRAVITRFEHSREDGLATCLDKAAAAVRASAKREDAP